jgi:oligoendopeptidase F
MTTTKRVPARGQVAIEDTWDLTALFPSDAAWDRAYGRLDKQIPRFETFRGKLGRSAKTLRACFDFQVAFEKQAECLGNYASLKSSEDLASSTYQGMLARYIHLATHANEASSFMAPEIQAIPKKRMDAFLKSPELKPYRFQLERLLRYRPHILSAPEERILAMQGEISDTADKIFSQLNYADLTFGFVRNERGEKIELTQGSFRTFLESPRRAVRKEAFDRFYAEYAAHANSLAAALGSSVLQDVYQARVRNFPSVRDASLFSEKVPVSVYDNLLVAVHANLDTVYRYLELRRKALRLRDLHSYDTYVPIVSMARHVTPYRKAVDTIAAALAPLGDEYNRTLRAGLLGRWVDRYENKGKRSGAFSSGGFSGPPYILMNYKDDVIDQVFTLAHEAGHSMHTYHSAQRQPFQDYRYTIFVAEVASTFNEQLVNTHLLGRAKDKTTRAFLINREIDEIRGTLIRQTMFAEFEKIIHEIAESGEPLTLERLRAEYRALLDLYFGPEFTVDEALSLECLRIPHFYSAFYVFKYATGLSAAIALAQQVLSGGETARKRYLQFLQGGGSKYPLDLLRDAGVDMETPEPVAAAMTRFRELVDALEELV